MTKSIRIENADTSDHKVNVFVERKNATGEWERVGDPIKLDHPTFMHVGTIWQGQRLVVEEALPEPQTSA
jgi:hypothetical protein